LVALGSLIVHAGFPLGERFGFWLDRLNIVLATGFCAEWLGEVFRAKRWEEMARSRRVELVLLGVFFFGLAVWLFLPDEQRASVASGLRQRAGEMTFVLLRVFLFGSVCIQLMRGIEWFLSLGIRAEVLLAISFFVLIGGGAGLLLLPNACSKPGAPISSVDAVFLSTSAACVTGLSVRDVGTELTTFGQVILMGIFQIGGLGIVTFVALLSCLSSRSLPVPQMVVFRQMINAPETAVLKSRIAGIFTITLLVEAAGAVALFFMVERSPDPLQNAKWAAFHSVSAFCNAGFGLEANNLEFAVAHPGVNLVIMGLIVIGGLGFLVIPEMLVFFRDTVRSIVPAHDVRNEVRLGRVRPRLSVQTRLSLWVTVALILLGMAGFWALEASHSLAGKDVEHSFWASAFQSVTTRTAGFNTVPIGQLQNATILLLIALMVVGGSPVSTAGGIKTVTFAILLLGLRAMIFGKDKIEAFGRTLPARAILSALNVFVLYVFTAMTGLILIGIFDPAVPIRDTFFEVISALSTVGLSTGITAGLSSSSKLVLCAMMFVGRVGPIAMVLSVFQGGDRLDYDFPDEDVVVG